MTVIESPRSELVSTASSVFEISEGHIVGDVECTLFGARSGDRQSPEPESEGVGKSSGVCQSRAACPCDDLRLRFTPVVSWSALTDISAEYEARV
jgi:hypothetical protein